MTTISSATYTRLLSRVQETPLEEVCGVVLRGKHIGMHNVHPYKENSYMFFGPDQLNVWADWGGQGDLIVYHSHPKSSALPSKADIVNARDPRIFYLIISVKYANHFFYRVDAGEVIEETLNIV